MKDWNKYFRAAIAAALLVYALETETPWAVNLSYFFVGLVVFVCLLGYFGGWKKDDAPSKVLGCMDAAIVALFAAHGWFWCASAWTFTSLSVHIVWPAMREHEREKAKAEASHA